MPSSAKLLNFRDMAMWTASLSCPAKDSERGGILRERSDISFCPQEVAAMCMVSGHQCDQPTGILRCLFFPKTTTQKDQKHTSFSPRCIFSLNRRFSKASNSIYLFNKRVSWCQIKASQHFVKLVTLAGIWDLQLCSVVQTVTSRQINLRIKNNLFLGQVC